MARLRPSRLASLGVLLFVCLMGSAFAQERFTRQVSFDIAAQSVEAALLEFSKQADVQVMVGTNAVNGQKTEGVKGTLSVKDALRELLKNTGLEYQTEGNSTVTIRSAAAAKTDAQVRPLVKGTRLVSRDAAGAATRNEFSTDGSGSDKSTSPTVEPLGEIVVTGSRLRTRESSPAVTTFDRTRIDALGAATVPELLEYLPQQTYNRGEAFNRGGAQFVEIRGLGVASTLVLVNGRRTVASATNLNQNAFDLNSIPLAAIDRVEVLSDSASAVYGADAMGGVINIILKKEIPAPVVDLNYGTAEGGGDERRASLSGGFGGERLRASVVLDYFDRKKLLGAERDRWRNQDHRRFGGADNRDTVANPGTVYSLTGDNLPGLTAPVAAVPTGASATPSTADFIATAGQENRDSLLRYWSIMPEMERRSAAMFAEFDMTSGLMAFAEALHSEGEVSIELDPPSLFFDFVPETNAFNPFGEPVLVSYLLSDLPSRRQTFESELDRVVLGLKGDLGEWDWEASVLHTTEDSQENLIGGLNFAALPDVLASSDPSQTLNVFSAGPVASPEVLQSLTRHIPPSDFTSRGTQASAMLRGTPFDLPAGPAELVLGSEWRKEGVIVKDFVTIDQEREAYAAFAELLLPLVTPAWAIPAVETLSFTVAARYDRYSDFGNTTNPQYAIAWSPISDLTFRVSYGTGFRAPSLFELYSPRDELPFPVSDPRRNGENALITLFTGGNPELNPIESEAFSAGLSFKPTGTGLSVSLNYWRVEIEERIAAFSPQILIGNEDLFPERIVRADPTPADGAAGLPGTIESIDISQINFGAIDTHGVDFSMSYTLELPFGRLTPSLASTWIGKYESADVPGQPPEDRLGVANFFGTIPKWKAVGSVEWSHNGVAASVTGRYVSSYDDAQFFGSTTGRTVSSQTLCDIQGSLDLGAAFGARPGWIKGFKVTAGVWNVFDKEPPFSEIGGIGGYDPSQGDLRQRFGYIRLGKSF